MDDQAVAFPSGSNLGAIVTRMQERAITVTKEEDELQRAKENLERVQHEYEVVLSKRKEIRQRYLQRQLDQNSAELEHIKTEQEIEATKKTTVKLKQEGIDKLAQLDNDKQMWIDGIELEIGQQRLRQMLYLSYLQGLVTAKEASIQQRSDRLVLVKDLTEDQKLVVKQLQQRHETIRTVELQVAKERYGEATTTAEKLVKELREAIAKRSSLRDILRERQDHYRNVQEISDTLASEFRS